MKAVSIFITVVFLLGLTACGGTKQDPLGDQPPEIQNGESPFKPLPPKELPMAQDVLRIDGADYFVFREGIDQEITINARSEFNDVKYTLEVINQNTFKNAVFTSVEGDASAKKQARVSMKWTPPKGMVFADVLTYQLETMVYTTSFTENFSHKKTFNVFVYKETFNVPEVISVTSLPNAVKEKSSATFKVKVKDVDGTETTLPSLLALTDYTQKNGAPYVSWGTPTQDPTDPEMWWFDVTINLADVDITNGIDTAEFAVSAVSAAGKKSNPQKVNFTVWNTLVPPVTSWLDIVEFKIGQKNQLNFTVVDPRGEGKLSTNFLTNCSSLAGSPVCSCKPKVGITGKADTMMACSIDWLVPANTPAQEQTIVFNAENKTTISGDSSAPLKAIFSGKIKLIP